MSATADFDHDRQVKEEEEEEQQQQEEEEEVLKSEDKQSFGIGITFSRIEDTEGGGSRIRIKQLVKHGSAETDGTLKEGDFITHVNGVSLVPALGGPGST
eukprot:180021-Hanusia_phi.AAC.1